MRMCFLNYKKVESFSCVLDLITDYYVSFVVKMGRRKQPKPQRSLGLITDEKRVFSGDEAEGSRRRKKKKKNVEDIDKPYYVNVSSSSSEKQERQHFDIAEVVLLLTNLSSREDGVCSSSGSGLDCSLRFRICNVASSVDRIKLGHWPVLSSSDVTLELVDDREVPDGSVVWSGGFDGPGEGVSGLAHLVSMKFLTLRLVPGDEGFLLSPRVRVELLQEAFDACESLLENTRQIWKKSMIHVMSWLRPEVMTSEARYGTLLTERSAVTEDETLDCSKQSRFDAAAFYEAIKPSK